MLLSLSFPLFFFPPSPFPLLGTVDKTYPHDLQLLQPPLHQLLHAALARLSTVLAKGIARAPPSVFAEIVGGELAGLAEEGTVLRKVVLGLKTWEAKVGC